MWWGLPVRGGRVYRTVQVFNNFFLKLRLTIGINMFWHKHWHKHVCSLCLTNFFFRSRLHPTALPPFSLNQLHFRLCSLFSTRKHTALLCLSVSPGKRSSFLMLLCIRGTTSSPPWGAISPPIIILTSSQKRKSTQKKKKKQESRSR